ncbi:MAG TPA: hypothetical protein VEA99_14320 [Gemmatimonadaceae bacterium]|nr:hypothetical protein [Gemmatimonadaceae bacterium]
MDSPALVLLLRLVHLFAGIFWVGGMFVVMLFVLPAQRSLADEGRFMRELMVARKLSTWFGVAAGLTVLAGFALYHRNIVVSDGRWASTPMAMTLGVGAVASLVAMIVGGAVSGRSQRRIAALAQRLAAAGAPPTPEQRQELATLQRRAMLGARLTLGLLVLATLTMAVARYL